MKKQPFNLQQVLVFLTIVLIIGMVLVFTTRLSLLEKETLRYINGIGLWFQLFGVILVSIEFLYSPLAKEQLLDYQEIRKKQWDEYNDSRKNTNSSQELLDAINKNDDKIKITRSVYSSVINFDVTVRTVYWFGFLSICSGYVLQLAAK